MRFVVHGTCTSTTPAAVDEFPNAGVVATRGVRVRPRPDWFADGGYIRADYDKPGVDWLLLEGSR